MFVRVHASLCVFLCIRRYLCVCACVCVAVCARASGRKKNDILFFPVKLDAITNWLFFHRKYFFLSFYFKCSEFLFTNITTIIQRGLIDTLQVTGS